MKPNTFNILLKYNSLFLGISIILFGILKFISPFRDWYSSQITMSGLPAEAFALGLVGEIMTGIFILIPFLFNVPDRLRYSLWAVGSLAIIVMMIVATYVHLHPHVSADVLPLKIKAPFIPLIFLGMGVENLAFIFINIRQKIKASPLRC